LTRVDYPIDLNVDGFPYAKISVVVIDWIQGSRRLLASTIVAYGS
jgi:hypothetical protein